MTAARTALSFAVVWPVFVWSRIGSQTARAGVRNQIRASQYSVGQLVAEWLAGSLIALTVASGGLLALWQTTGPTSLIALAGVAVFPPSLALVAGLWTGSPRLFEASYLALWYLGPLNGGYPVDFAGVTEQGVALFVRIAFALVGIVGVVAAVQHRRTYGPL